MRLINFKLVQKTLDIGFANLVVLLSFTDVLQCFYTGVILAKILDP